MVGMQTAERNGRAIVVRSRVEGRGIKMAVKVILEVKAKPGTGNELVAFFRSILGDTRAHDGCVSVETLRNSDDADHVVVVEAWESRGQYEKYLAWQRDRGTSARLMEGLAEPPSIRHFDVTDA
jgi:quinol monooxygenase YgiN